MRSHLSRIKLVALDIGKTIFDKDKQSSVSSQTLEMIHYLKNRNIKVGVCTMRTIKSCKELIPLGLDFYISLNGAYVQCDNKVIINLRICNNFDEECLSYSKNYTYYSNNSAHQMALQNGFLASKKGVLKKAYVITLFNKDEESIDQYKNYYSCSYWNNTKVLTLQSKLCSKVNALRKVLEFYNINENEMLFFGDGPNDLDLFKAFTNTIMVGNGYPILKNYAFDICDNCEDDGVSKYILGKLRK